jgi:O-antigen/teichoic acid export membrane protein
MAENLKEKTAKGLFWGLLNNGTMQVLNLVFGIFLGRLLSPEDYGIVGVLAIFTAIAGDLQSAGFSQALINIKSPTDRDYNSVFWFNVLVSIVLYAVLFLCAPLIALFFHQPVLTEVSRFVFLAFLISSLGIAHNAYLTKNLMVKEQTIAGITALVCSGTVGIILAWQGHAYWALAWQQVVYISVLNIIRLRYSRWRPSMKIDFGPVRRMFPFAVNLLGTKVLTTLSQNILTFIFGRMLPIHAVGNFSQANKWNTMGHTLVSGTIAQVAQPVMAEIAEDDDREVRVFRKMLRFTAFLSFPAMIGLALVASEFILLTVGKQWEGCVPLLQILCIGGAFMPIYTLYQNLVISKGRSDIYLWCNVVQIVAQIALVLVFGKYGITAMVEAYVVFNILYLLVWHWQTQRVLHLRLWHVVLDIIPFALAALIVMVATYFATNFIENNILLLVCRILLAALLYFLLMKLSHAVVLEECLQYVLKKKK